MSIILQFFRKKKDPFGAGRTECEEGMGKVQTGAHFAGVVPGLPAGWGGEGRGELKADTGV